MAPRLFDPKLRSRESVEQIAIARNGVIQTPRPSVAVDSAESLPLARPEQLEHTPAHHGFASHPPTELASVVHRLLHYWL